MLSLPEGVVLYKITNSFKKGSIIVEIGCYGGLSSAFMLAGAKKKSTVLYSIDPFDSDIKDQEKKIEAGKDKDYNKEEIQILINKPSKRQVEALLEECSFSNFHLISDYSFNVVKKWRKQIDLLWIDGDHDYNEVKKDYAQWSPFLRKGGLIVFHDANKKSTSGYWDMGWDGPTEVVREYIKEPEWTNIRRVDSIVYAEKKY